MYKQRGGIPISGVSEQYYNAYGQKIRDPRAYAETGAPMYTKFHTAGGSTVRNPERYLQSGGKLYHDCDINEEKIIYKVNCETGKKYIGMTNNFERRMDQHFSGRGAKVTQKFEPKDAKEIV